MLLQLEKAAINKLTQSLEPVTAGLFINPNVEISNLLRCSFIYYQFIIVKTYLIIYDLFISHLSSF